MLSDFVWLKLHNRDWHDILFRNLKTWQRRLRNNSKMESVESDLLAKLENIFGFQYGKGKKYQDLGTKDFLDVYKIFFRIYDSAWLLNDEKPTGTVIKQIQR